MHALWLFFLWDREWEVFRDVAVIVNTFLFVVSSQYLEGPAARPEDEPTCTNTSVTHSAGREDFHLEQEPVVGGKIGQGPSSTFWLRNWCLESGRLGHVPTMCSFGNSEDK